MVLTTTERTNDLMKIELKKNLSLLELSDLVKIIEEQEKDIKLVDLSYDERLELLLDALVQERENRLIGRLIRNAEFKYPNASLESLDHDPRQIKKSTIINLAAMGFISNATNLFILGPTGAGRHIFPVHWVLKPAGRHIGYYISECLTLCVISKTIGMISGH